MLNTTLCYIEYNGKYLMLNRNKKIHDLNEGKWIGIGGKFLPGETPEECLLREVKEETGLSLTDYHFYGIVHFRSDEEDEEMYLYSAEICDTNGLIPLDSCDEGTLAWIPKDKLLELPTWEGDYIFLKKMLAGETQIEMTLEYDHKKLIRAVDHLEKLNAHQNCTEGGMRQ